MKFFIVTLAVVCSIAVVQSAKLSAEEEERVFNHWLRKHKIKVPDNEQGKKWKENVLKRLNEIEEHNERYRKGEETFETALNHFSHLTREEMASRHGIKIPDNYKHPEDKVVPVQKRSKRAADNLPAYLNWADYGIVHPATNQGACSSCYAFAGVGVIESHACRYFNQCTKLSEQEAMECTDGCNGGWDEFVYNYSNISNGCAKETDYSYYARTINQCNSDTAYFPRVSNTKVVDYRILPSDEYTIRHHLYNNGPLWVTFKAYDNFQRYGEGVYDKPSGDFFWHAIMMVGYGTDPVKGDYWIIRNSWGENWGQKGFGKMKRGIDLCEIESKKVSYPIIGKA